MSYDFNIKEILKMAERIEENGMIFYKNAAEKTSDSDNKKFLLNLSEMEKQHKTIFSKIKKELTENEIEDTIFDPNNESSQYIKALVDLEIFFKKTTDFNSIKEILKEAILAEKDSIVFYLGIKKLVPAKKGQEKIDIIINEEMNHIKLLSNKLKNIN